MPRTRRRASRKDQKGVKEDTLAEDTQEHEQPQATTPAEAIDSF
jgi:hypothetical protein